jgi:voltage-gated potassium channel
MGVARYRFVVELSIIFILVWVGGAMLVFWFEAGHSPRIHSFTEAFYALLVTMTTSGDSAVTPVTVAGRTVVGVALILSKLLTALLCALAGAILIERKVKEEMGLKMHKLSQHVIVIGWNLKGPQVIRTLRNDPQYAHAPILVMADMEHKPSAEDHLLLFTRSTYPIRGEAIERACVAEAATIVVLAQYTEKQHADSLTAINCMMARQANPKARIVAELLDSSQRAYLEAAGADLVVGMGDVGGFLLAEAAIGTEQARQLLAFACDSGPMPAVEQPEREDRPASVRQPAVYATK